MEYEKNDIIRTLKAQIVFVENQKKGEKDIGVQFYLRGCTTGLKQALSLLEEYVG